MMNKTDEKFVYFGCKFKERTLILVVFLSTYLLYFLCVNSNNVRCNTMLLPTLIVLFTKTTVENFFLSMIFAY